MSQLKVDLALVQKYNVPGPRYTSYPPATFFTEQVSWPALSEELLENNKTQRDLSLYFHIPFCYSLCWYCGCHTVITTQQNQSATYLDYLKKELARMATVLNPKRKVVQMHLGGGSPTFMTPEEICTLGRMIHSQFQVSPEVEAGVEIDPRRLSRDHVKALREAGFNRASVGIQDFDPQVQKATHRIQPREMTEEVIHWIRQAGFQSLNFDLIYGLPYQTVESFDRTLDQVLELAPDRFAVFSYAHVPWVKPAQKILETTAALPTAEVKLQLLKLITEKLTGTGKYAYIGMDHFARTTDELVVAQRNKSLQRNFQGYSTHGEADIYSFGISAISQTPNAYWQNLKELPAYYEALDAGKSPAVRGYLLTPDDKLRRVTIMRLMCDLGLDYAYMARLLEIDFPDYFARELDSLDDLEADGLIRQNAFGLEVTQTGRLFIRNIAMRFDAHLPRQTERQYSRTI
jgi:oxygen-independent coproporphyrinogen-3 oxidase